MTHDVGALQDLLLLAGISLVVLLVFQRLRVAPAVGFIATGVLVGPGGFHLVGDLGLINMLAELGVAFLLFTVGLEFSRRELLQLGRPALVGGALQILFTGGLVAAIVLIGGLHPAQAIFIGMLASLSSTALVLRLLSDRLELTAPHGRLTTGILVFQDLAVIGFAVAVPWLGRWHSGQSAVGGATLDLVLRGLGLLAAVGLLFALARRIAPWLLERAL